MTQNVNKAKHIAFSFIVFNSPTLVNKECRQDDMAIYLGILRYAERKLLCQPAWLSEILLGVICFALG